MMNIASRHEAHEVSRMQRRENFTMAAVGGAAGLFVTTLYIALGQAGVSAGEWLQFAAVFLGVVATISGTLWLQGHTERNRAERRVNNLLRSLGIPRLFLSQISKMPTSKDTPMLEAVDRAFSHVKWARDQLEAPSYVSHAIFESLMEIWDTHRPILADDLKYARMYPASPAPKVTETADFIVEWIDRTIATIKREENSSYEP